MRGLPLGVAFPRDLSSTRLEFSALKCAYTLIYIYSVLYIYTTLHVPDSCMYERYVTKTSPYFRRC